MPNRFNTPITPQRTPLLDPRTGLISQDWYRFFLSLYEVTKRLSWNFPDDTLNVSHKNGVNQQVGQENFFPPTCNQTGSTIPNGTAVGAVGVANDCLLIAPYIANSSADPLLYLGVATEDILDGAVGKITWFGYVRDLDTSMWSINTILYPSPTTAGDLTSTRPTAPNSVIVTAIVTKSDASAGEILVRITRPTHLDYASYTSTVDQTAAAANTAYPVTFNTTEFEHGITVVSGSRITATQAGLYEIQMSLQVTSSNSASSKVFGWLRKNGTNVARTRRDFTIKANGDTKVFGENFQLSLQIGDYVEVMWAADTTNVFLDADIATAFAPDAPSASVQVNQIQL